MTAQDVETLATGIALVLTPIAATAGAYFAYRGKVQGRKSLRQTDTKNGHTIAESVLDTRERVMGIADKLDRHIEDSTADRRDLRWQLARHEYTYEHDRKLNE